MFSAYCCSWNTHDFKCAQDGHSGASDIRFPIAGLGIRTMSMGSEVHIQASPLLYPPAIFTDCLIVVKAVTSGFVLLLTWQSRQLPCHLANSNASSASPSVRAVPRDVSIALKVPTGAV